MALEVAGSKPVTRPISPQHRGPAGFLGASKPAGLLVYWQVKTECAGVAELVDALVLGTSGESRGGSSPSARTRLGSIAFDLMVGKRATTETVSSMVRSMRIEWVPAQIRDR